VLRRTLMGGRTVAGSVVVHLPRAQCWIQSYRLTLHSDTVKARGIVRFASKVVGCQSGAEKQREGTKMIRTTIIAGGLLGLGIFTAAPAMAVEGMQVDCSNPCVIVPVPGLVHYYTGLGNSTTPTAAQEFTTAWTQGPGQAVNAWATGPATVAKVWSDALVNGGGTLALGPAAPAPPA
jgi:hypothetical protein